MNFFLWVFTGMLLTAGGISGRTIFVKVDADPGNSLLGDDWENSTNLLRALILAEPNDQIWVAAGIYVPDRGQGAFQGSANSSFWLKDKVAILGGFQGSEMLLSERILDPSRRTIFSGDLGQDDWDPDQDGIIARPEDTRGVNAASIVSGAGVGREAILDGVTLTAASSLKGKGDAIFLRFGASPSIYTCEFIGNYANYGGAIYCEEGSGPTIFACFFLENSACESGGAIYCDWSSPSVVNCTFINHFVDGDPDAFSISRRSSPLIANSIIWNNRVERPLSTRGPTFVDANSFPLFSHCLIQGSSRVGFWEENHGTNGGANFDLSPGFIAETFEPRVDSPVRDAGLRVFLPADIADLDGDGDTVEPVAWSFSGILIELGCRPYDFDADSDADDFSDRFEAKITGDALSLSVPQIFLSQSEEGLDEITMRCHRNLRLSVDFVFEFSPSFGSQNDWSEIEAKRVYSSLIGGNRSEYRYRVTRPEMDGFYRVVTRAK